MRAQFQVLVIPFAYTDILRIAIFQRSDNNYMQFIAGGGEENETPIEAAKREAYEEASIDAMNQFYKLDTVSSVPRNQFSDHKNNKSIYVIPEYCFGVQLYNSMLSLSTEHLAYKWVNYDTAMKSLTYDSNKTALWELNERIKEGKINLTIAST